MSGVRYVTIDETVWPVPDWSLLDPRRTQGDAIAMLKRARRAATA